MTHYQCPHVRHGMLPAVTRVVQTMVPGAPSRSDLETETLLCALCTGLVVATLMGVERYGTGDPPC